MKRHESLAPLSREHHSALILAQLIKKNAPAYKDLPATMEDKIQYAINMFNNELKSHFQKEEAMLKEVELAYHGISLLADQIVDEHRSLAALFLSLNNATDPGAVLDKLGNELEAHIRKEERVLFPLVQQYCPEEVLAKLRPMLA